MVGVGPGRRRWCPAPTSTWWSAPGGWPVLVPPVGPTRRHPAAVTASGGARCRRASTACWSSAAATWTPPATARTPTAATAGSTDGGTSSSSSCWTRPLERDLPVLAVCRGPRSSTCCSAGPWSSSCPTCSARPATSRRPGAFGEVTVVCEPGTHVHRLLGDRAEVLCSHHQAVDALGESLAGVGPQRRRGRRGRGGPGPAPFAVGVQWHPEESRDLRLFEGLVDAAAPRPTGRPDPGATRPSDPPPPGTPSHRPTRQPTKEQTMSDVATSRQPGHGAGRSPRSRSTGWRRPTRPWPGPSRPARRGGRWLRPTGPA